MDDQHFGWLSLVPPLVAISLAILSRKPILSIAIGILTGSLILAQGNLIEATRLTGYEFLWQKLTAWDKVQVYSFTLLTGGMIGIVSAAGGLRGVVNLILPWANTRSRGQLTSWAMGLVVFFDDYANMLLLGGTLREVTDRLKISREKLAYIVDSTAAPVAGLALISTWVATEIDYIQQGLDQSSLGEDSPSAFQIFLWSMPYRFYTWWALLFVPIIAVLNRDFGPMLTAERRAIDQNPLDEDLADQPQVEALWPNAVLPIGSMLAVVLGVLLSTGFRSVYDGEQLPSLMEIVGNGDSYAALLYGSAAGVFVAWLVIAPQQLLSLKGMVWAMLKGMQAMLPAVLILWFSAALAEQTSAPITNDIGEITSVRLGTADYLKGMIETSIPMAALPTVIFALASFVAFSTGTSWGTMGILMPLSVSVTLAIQTEAGIVSPVESTLLACVVGSVLAGAIFGDHCSPISDTTILSSQSCGCEHTAHVRTQLPYAMVIAVLAVCLGTAAIAVGISVWVSHLVAIVSMVLIVRLLGKRPNQPSTDADLAEPIEIVTKN